MPFIGFMNGTGRLVHVHSRGEMRELPSDGWLYCRTCKTKWNASTYQRDRGPLVYLNGITERGLEVVAKFEVTCNDDLRGA
jgi:hypothetical protein